MKKYIRSKIHWQDPIVSNQYLTVSYRKASDPDVSGSYTVVTESLLVDTEGNLPTPLVIEFPLQDTEYVIRFKVNGYTGHYDETTTTPKEYQIVGAVDNIHQVYPSTLYTIPFVDFGKAHLPETGLYYELKGAPTPTVGTETPLSITGPMVFEERQEKSGLKIGSGTIATFPATMNELSVLGINEEQGLKDYSFGFWFNISVAEFASMAQQDKIWLMYTGDETKHTGIYIDNATKFLTWERKNMEVTEQSVLGTQIPPDTWCKVFVSKTVNGQDLETVCTFIVSFNGVDYTPTVPINFTGATNYTGSSLNPIYVGAGRNSSGTIIPSNGIFSKLFYSNENVSTELRSHLLNPIPSKIFVGSLEIEDFSFTESEITFSIPDDIAPGSTEISVSSYRDVFVPVEVDVLVLEENETGFSIDFTDETSGNQREMLSDKFWTLDTEIGDGSVVPAQVYVEFEKLAMEVQGNNTVTGKSKVGSAVVSKDYYGYGSYKVKALVPQSEGAVFSMFVSSDDSQYDFISTNDFSTGVNHICYSKPTGANDGEFHDFEFRWKADSIEFYFDGLPVETIEEGIPERIGRFGIAMWFPGDAGFMFDKLLIESITFEAYTDIEADGTNTIVGESYPFENLVEIGV